MHSIHTQKEMLRIQVHILHTDILMLRRLTLWKCYRHTPTIFRCPNVFDIKQRVNNNKTHHDRSILNHFFVSFVRIYLHNWELVRTYSHPPVCWCTLRLSYYLYLVIRWTVRWCMFLLKVKANGVGWIEKTVLRYIYICTIHIRKESR